MKITHQEWSAPEEDGGTLISEDQWDTQSTEEKDLRAKADEIIGHMGQIQASGLTKESEQILAIHTISKDIEKIVRYLKNTIP